MGSGPGWLMAWAHGPMGPALLLHVRRCATQLTGSGLVRAVWVGGVGWSLIRGQLVWTALVALLVRSSGCITII